MELRKIFEPKTMAIVGVSLSSQFHPANVIHNKNHLRYKAESFSVNPKGGTLYGQRVYKNLKEIPSQIELAELAVWAELVPQAIRECREAGSPRNLSLGTSRQVPRTTSSGPQTSAAAWLPNMV